MLVCSNFPRVPTGVAGEPAAQPINDPYLSLQRTSHNREEQIIHVELFVGQLVLPVLIKPFREIICCNAG